MHIATTADVRRKQQDKERGKELAYKSQLAPNLLLNLQIPVRLRSEITVIVMVDANETIFPS